MADADAEENRRPTKIERVMDRYELSGLQAELVARWTAPQGERDSLRDLAQFVNERLLAVALEEAGHEALPGEVENYYRLLRDDDVSAGRRMEARSSLEQAGIDVERLESDFVSHQAVHTYLTDRAGVEFEGVSTEERLSRTRGALARLEGRLRSVAERNLDQLEGADHLDVGDVNVLVSLDVVCTGCGERYDFETLLDQGGCACGASVDAE
jgi:hypothetical protein